MYARLDGEKVFSISGVRNPALFFPNLGKLLPGEDYILGIASFMPDAQVAHWLKNLPSLPIPGRFNFRHLTKGLSENADGGAYYLHPTRQNIAELTQLAAAVVNNENLCSHVIAFRGHEGLFSFHDAFDCDDILISSKIPEEHVVAFSLALGSEWKRIVNPQELWRKS